MVSEIHYKKKGDLSTNKIVERYTKKCRERIFQRINVHRDRDQEKALEEDLPTQQLRRPEI